MPAATPRPIITQLNGAFGKILQLPDVREAFARQGMEPQHSTPAEFAALIAREIEQTAKLMQAAGIKAE